MGVSLVMSSNNPIKIVHVIHKLTMGGMENGLVNLVNGMDPQFEHHIVSLTDSTDFRERITNARVTVHELHKRPGKDVMVYWRLWRALRQIKPHIVHTRNFGTVDCALAARLAGRVKLIHSEHGWDMQDVHGTNRRYLTLRRWMSHLAVCCVAVSQNIELWLEQQVGVARKKLLQIYNGVDSQRFYPSLRERSDPLVIGFVGRIEEVKNLPSLVRAIERLSNTDHARSIEVQIVGTGSYESQLRALISEAGLQDTIILLGSQADIPSLMRGFDVFVLPSFNEGISNTILEAMASGLPIVAADVGGNAELVSHGVNGQLYPSDDDATLEQYLSEYVDNDALRVEHGKASRALVEQRFTLKRMISEYENLYAGLAGPA